ncbi:MAG: polyamine aminopropyltransferase [Candidatus Wildermuthbacteria bacterium]|nr:polyamine aminopropyltransferase [Candidatus Wildermuthbacteria bacterium]
MKIKSLFGRKWAFEENLPEESKDILSGIAITKKVFAGKSKYQEIEVFDTPGYGRVLYLDGFMQLSSLHEFVYHEMLVHPALLSHPRPERVLIVGGGDGGTLREVLKHPVQEVLLVEIDKMVLDVSQKYLPGVSQGSFKDPRVSLKIADGGEAIRHFSNYFDCVLVDSTDPDGNEAKILFKRAFYKDAKRALRKEGIMASQTGYLSEHFGQRTRKEMQSLFPFFSMHRAFVRCFPADEHSFSLASSKIDLARISLSAIERAYKARKLETSYYSPLMHEASRIFPDSVY